MNDFLQQLLEHELDNRHLDFRQAPGYQERLERISACHDQIRASLGLDFLDRLNDLEAKCPIMSGWPASGTASVWPGVSSWNFCLELRADVGICPYGRARRGGRPQEAPPCVWAARCSCRGGLYGRPFCPIPRVPEREPRSRGRMWHPPLQTCPRGAATTRVAPTCWGRPAFL